MHQFHLVLAGLLALHTAASAFVIRTSKISRTCTRPSSTSTNVGLNAAAGGEEATAARVGSVGFKEDLPQALIFDCDGVLADTERDGHRPAFNAAFKIKNLGEYSRHVRFIRSDDL